MKKITLMILSIGMFTSSVINDQLYENVYLEESNIQNIMKQIHEDDSVNTYKFNVRNTWDFHYMDVVYYIDNVLQHTDYNILRLSRETEYFIIGTTANSYMIRVGGGYTKINPEVRHVKEVADGFSLQGTPQYVRTSTSIITDYDYILRFENTVDGHVYRIDFLWRDSSVIDTKEKWQEEYDKTRFE